MYFINKSIKKLLLLLILLTPLFGLFEGIGFLNINLGIQMIHVKALKMLIILIILFLSTSRVFLNKFKKTPLFGVFLFIVGILSTILALITSSIEYAYAGVNFIFPFFIMFFTIGIFDRKFINKLVKIISFVLVLNLVLQFYQMFFMPPYGGKNFLGLTGRVPGFFSNASIGGALAAFSFYFIKYHSIYNKKKTFTLLILASLSVVLSMSSAAAGLLLVLFIFPYFLNSKLKGLSYLLLLPIVFFLMSNLDSISGRTEGQSSESFSTRKRILIGQMERTSLIPIDFGRATNLANNFRRQLDMENDAFISDMMYTATLVNFGWILSIIIFLYFLRNIFFVFNFRKIDVKMFFLISILASSSLIISEIFPINYLISIMGAFYYKSKK